MQQKTHPTEYETLWYLYLFNSKNTQLLFCLFVLISQTQEAQNTKEKPTRLGPHPERVVGWGGGVSRKMRPGSSWRQTLLSNTPVCRTGHWVSIRTGTDFQILPELLTVFNSNSEFRYPVHQLEEEATDKEVYVWCILRYRAKKKSVASIEEGHNQV